MARKLLETPDPRGDRRAEMVRFAEAYEAAGRGLGPHFDALAEALAGWGPVFDHAGIRYTRQPGRDFMRGKIRDDNPLLVGPRGPVEGNPRRGKVHAFGRAME